MTESVDPSGVITAELQGGVGNQLFVVAAGLAQAIRLNVPLVLDASQLGSKTNRHVQRDLEIQPLLKHLEYPVSVVSTPVTSVGAAVRQVRLRTPGGRTYRERDFNYSDAIETVKVGQTLHGYFQSPLYFSHGADELLNRAMTALADEYSIAASSEVFMHIRRGDYLLARHQSHHGLASIDYFDRAATVMRELHPKATFRIFTDSPDQIPSDFLDRWGAKLDDNQLDVAPIQALLMLAANDGLIMSNSSFSWWAAWIAQARNPDATFIAPRPWLASGASAHTLLPASWLSLGS